VTKFLAYLALFLRSDTGQTDRQTTDTTTKTEGFHTVSVWA